ncbi:hypothetical protein D3C75_929460 [compost metagenome]
MLLTFCRSSCSRVCTLTVLGTWLTSWALRVALTVTCCRAITLALAWRSSTTLPLLILRKPRPVPCSRRLSAASGGSEPCTPGDATPSASSALKPTCQPVTWLKALMAETSGCWPMLKR